MSGNPNGERGTGDTGGSGGSGELVAVQTHDGPKLFPSGTVCDLCATDAVAVALVHDGGATTATAVCRSHKPVVRDRNRDVDFRSIP